MGWQVSSRPGETPCPSCAGRGTVHNASSHDDNPCSTCRGTGRVPDEVDRRMRTRSDGQKLVEQLNQRGYKAFSAGDDELASLLRKAAQTITGLLPS